MEKSSFDFIVIGGGLVGSSIAYGLSRQTGKVAVLDEGDRAFRASRGNFGLVWVQSKGWDFPPYAKWTSHAANLWPELDEELKAATGIDVQYCRPGGMEFCLSVQDWESLSHQTEQIHQHTGGGFEYAMLEHAEVKKRIPQISKNVLGASYSPQDGHVNPLYLLRAFHQCMDDAGVSYLPNHHVEHIENRNGEFIVHSNQKTLAAERIVLCSGLDNERLGKMLEITIPVKANRGQLLITERVQPFLHYPTLHVRQTAEGGLQIGDSAEDAGLDDRTSNAVISMLAERAVRIFPMLEHVRLVRAWAALRVMTPDGKPVYQESKLYPGAFGVACHSGVTLAAAHAGPVSRWIGGKEIHPLISSFTADRFNV